LAGFIIIGSKAAQIATMSREKILSMIVPTNRTLRLLILPTCATVATNDRVSDIDVKAVTEANFVSSSVSCAVRTIADRRKRQAHSLSRSVVGAEVIAEAMVEVKSSFEAVAEAMVLAVAWTVLWWKSTSAGKK
jgi:hypothetical protein